MYVRSIHPILTLWLYKATIHKQDISKLFVAHFASVHETDNDTVNNNLFNSGSQDVMDNIQFTIEEVK